MEIEVGGVSTQGFCLVDPNGSGPVKASAGAVQVNTEGQKATYSTTLVNFTPAATATDFLVIQGSATKTVRITRVLVTGQASSGAIVDLLGVIRTAANTGGTTTPANVAQHDQSDPAPSAVAVSYSVNPTGLGAGKNVRSTLFGLAATTGGGFTPQVVEWEFGTRNGRAIVLRGVNQFFALNWNGLAVPAGTSLHVDVEWTEE